MNGIKYIREKSNFTRNALAERMGVTRQTVTLWERGVRRPDKNHLKWLCVFYGVEEKWFGELSDADMAILKEMKMRVCSKRSTDGLPRICPGPIRVRIRIPLSAGLKPRIPRKC